MLETIRAFARERLAGSAEEAELRRRHADWYCDSAEAGQRDSERSGRDWPVFRAWIEAEHDNLRAALEWARDSGADEALLRLAASVGFYWVSRGLVHEAETWLPLALERTSSPPG